MSSRISTSDLRHGRRCGIATARPAWWIVGAALVCLASTGCPGQGEDTGGASRNAAGGANTTTAQGKRAEKAGIADGSAKNAANRVSQFRSMAKDGLSPQSPAVPVAVAEVQRGVIEAFYSGSTNLTAAEEAVVVARTSGVVEALFAEEGDMQRFDAYPGVLPGSDVADFISNAGVRWSSEWHRLLLSRLVMTAARGVRRA